MRGVTVNEDENSRDMDQSLFWTRASAIAWDLIQTFLAQRHVETEVLDYKGIPATERGRDHALQEIVETIAAMANTDSGIVLCGVHPHTIDKTRPGHVVGLQQRDIDGLKDKCRSHLQPPFVPETISVRIADSPEDRYVVVVRLNPETVYRPVVVRDKGVFVRIGDSTKSADLYRLRQLFSESGFGTAVRFPTA